MLLKAFGTVISVHCPEFRGGHFSEVSNVFQSGPEALPSLGSVSTSRTVRFRRFYCTLVTRSTKIFILFVAYM